MDEIKRDPTTEHLANRLAESYRTLAAAWLERLDQILDVDKRRVFPTHHLLDHIPDLIVEIAHYLRAPAEQEIAANTAVMAKAAELGLLRFDQQASVHQLLREYQLFSEVIEEFFERETSALGADADAVAAVQAVGLTHQAVRVLMQKTVDAFVTRYTDAIERQNARLRNFSRLLSHEIRQPLGVLQVLAQTIHVPAGDGESARLLQTLDRNVVRLSDVARKLELLARLTRRSDNGPNEQQVSLTLVVQDVARQLAEMAAARGVEIVIGDDLPVLVADAGRVELAVINLVANAIKYSDPDKPARFVRLDGGPASPGPVVRVTDNGLGIPASKLTVIFDQFVRVHGHLDDELGAHGMGLGLSIVQESMEAMGGGVTVTSAEGSGTTFTLTWPLAAATTSAGGDAAS